ncbi:MFS transporter [Nonomuraea sp. NPDC000554]|uniref:MFS transporter n=1 Tax=Nonomuraea sp. NPDC000554 TaxID=3154259 RepID=UPI003320C6E9
MPKPARAASDRQALTVIVSVQLAISLGFFAVMAHLVAHLRHDLGLLAGTITLVLGVRIAVQYGLLLPVGAVADVIGPARAGALACAVRAAGFALLGAAGGLTELLGAAVLLGAGGALFHPAAQSLLAGVAPTGRARGFAAYVAAGQVAAVAGPPAGLALLAGGFGTLAGAAAAAWAVAALLFLLLPHRSAAARPAGVLDGAATAARDRTFLRFAVAAAPSTLLADQVMTVVPLKDVGSGATTVFLCVVAAVASAVQPWCAAHGRAGRPWVLRAGLLCSGAGYLVLMAVPAGGGPMVVLLAAAALNGLGNGLTQPAVFQAIARYAPAHRFGAYFGVLGFLAGAVTVAGGLAVGRLFDAGSTGAAAALAGLALVAVASAAATRTPAARSEAVDPGRASDVETCPLTRAGPAGHAPGGARRARSGQ